MTTSLQWSLSSVPKVAVVERFNYILYSTGAITVPLLILLLQYVPGDELDPNGGSLVKINMLINRMTTPIDSIIFAHS